MSFTQFNFQTLLCTEEKLREGSMVLPLNPAALERLNDTLHEFRQIGAVQFLSLPFALRSPIAGLWTTRNLDSLLLVGRQAHHDLITEHQGRDVPRYDDAAVHDARGDTVRAGT